MADQGVERRLAAILAADVAGYSRLVGLDEEGTLARLRTLRQDIIDPQIASHRGRIVKTTGDGLLVEFASVVDAVRCAVSVQRALAEQENTVPDDRRIQFRIGVNLGDVVVEDDDILGDGVNVAARLEGIAEPGSVCISEDAHRQVRGKVEIEFTDLGEQTVKNIALPIRAYRYGLHPTAAPIPSAALPLPDRPSIAVLPFENMSGDPDQEYFADGMVEEITTALSRIRWLFVIARNSSFTYKGQAVDVKRVGRELGVRYVLEGSVRKGGGRVRITAQLVEAESGTHLWADHFDGALEDVFELQDKVASSVAGVIEPTLQAAEMRRSTARSRTSLNAYDLYLRALASFYQMTKEKVIEALGFLDEAIALDPHYGPALSYAAACHGRLAADSWAEDRKASRRKAVDLARQALQVADDDPDILSNAALQLIISGEDIGTMISLVERALTLNPSYARGWYRSSVLRTIAGQHDLAIEHFEISLRLSPRGRTGPFPVIGAAYFFKRQFDDAASKLLLNIQDHPGTPFSYRILAACYAHMGRLDDANAIIARLRAVTTQVLPDDVPFRRDTDRELLLSGLRLAMGEPDAQSDKVIE